MKLEKYYKAVFKQNPRDGGYIEHFYQENPPTKEQLIEKVKYYEGLEFPNGSPKIIIHSIGVDPTIYYSILHE